jgi:hypothetical protein
MKTSGQGSSAQSSSCEQRHSPQSAQAWAVTPERQSIGETNTQTPTAVRKIPFIAVLSASTLVGGRLRLSQALYSIQHPLRGKRAIGLIISRTRHVHSVGSTHGRHVQRAPVARGRGGHETGLAAGSALRRRTSVSARSYFFTIPRGRAGVKTAGADYWFAWSSV